jgi:NADH:ubiquinone oxidoreductase subunit B-like Fe-S oxidoreductase
MESHFSPRIVFHRTRSFKEYTEATHIAYDTKRHEKIRQISPRSAALLLLAGRTIQNLAMRDATPVRAAH